MNQEPQTTDTTQGEFTIYCSRYYELTVQHAAQETNLQTQLLNAPVYNGQTLLSEIDAIISYYREVQAAKTEMDKTFDNLKITEGTILRIMRHFEIPPGTILTGEIPGELEYSLWADDNDMLHIIKTKNLAPLVAEENIITIKIG